MSRVKQVLNLLISQDTVGNTKVFDRQQHIDDPDVTDQLPLGRSSSLVVPASGSATIPLTGISEAKLIFIETDAEVALVINGSLTPLPIVPRVGPTPASAPVKGRFLVWTKGVTSIALTNASTSTAANVTWAVAGS